MTVSRTSADSARAVLEQIAIVCTDNMDRSCDHRMALDFVRHLANDHLDAAQALLPPNHVAVPKTALNWLFGDGPDEKGWQFGECHEAQKAMNTKNPRRYWWRAKFRKMISATPTPAPSSWQPIETAPRDGTRIFVTGGGIGNSRIDIASYNERIGAWDTTENTLDDRDDERDGYNRPELWQLLTALALPSTDRGGK